MRKNRIAVFTFVVFILILADTSFPQIIGFRTYGAREGLLQSQVQTILQDKQGYLWFGTLNGIYKFDGKEFKNITKVDGLSSNYIEAGFKDSRGNLYFGHSNATISRYDWETKTFNIIKLLPKNERVNFSVISFAEDKKGRIWAGTLGRGLFIIDRDTILNINKKSGLRSNFVHDIEPDLEQNLWIATGAGINIYDPDQNKMTWLNRDSSGYTSILIRKDNTKWLATYWDGIRVLDKKNNQIQTFAQKSGLDTKNIIDLFEDHTGRIWVASEDKGLYYFIPNGEHNLQGQFGHYTTANGLSYNDLIMLTEDYEGNLWIATGGKGACQLRDESFKVYTTEHGLIDNGVWAIHEDRAGRIWFGTTEGISYLPQSRNRSGRPIRSGVTGGKIKYVTEIIEDVRGGLWALAYQDGIYKKAIRSNRWRKVKLPKDIYPPEVTTIAIDDRNVLWIGTMMSGLYAWNLNNKRLNHFLRKDGKITSDTIKAIYKDSSGKLWIGALNGEVVTYDGKEFRKIKGTVKSAFDFAQDSVGSIWIITQNDELYRYYQGTFENFTNRGLQGQTLYFVIAYKNSVWVGTTRGLARLRDGGDKFEFYGYKEGYPFGETNEKAAFRDSKGNLWFGTIDGAVQFDQKKEQKNLIPPKTYLTGIDLFHEPATFRENATYAHNKNYFTFHFIGLSFTVPEKVLYQYKLDGVDSDWSPPSGATEATYPYLPPGNYQFLVKACNNDGVWNPQPVTYSFVIMAPFWKQAWFIFLMVIIFMAGFYLVMMQVTKNVERERRLLEEKVRDRTSELVKEKEEVERALQALHESELKFRTYTELASSGIYIHTRDRFLYINKAVESISGYTREELLTMNVWELVHPDDLPLLQNRFRARIEGDKNVPGRYEFRVISKEGEIRWLDFSGRVIQYDGEPAVLATVVDITDRKRAEDALLQEKERLFVTLRSISEAVIAVDSNLKIILANKKAEEILNLPKETLEQNHFDHVFRLQDERSQKTIDNPVNTLIKTGGKELLEGSGIYEDSSGRKRILEYSVAPLKDRSSKLQGAVVVLRDITDKKRFEEELLKSQKLESVGILAGGIAHDFNNILTAIIGNLSLIRMQTSPDTKIFKRIVSAEKAAARAQELTHQLLTFSKGGAPIKETTSIKELIRDSVEFILSGSNVKVDYKIDEDLPKVEVDSGQISQVIQNLVINADQAMPNGGTIYVQVTKKKIKSAKDPELAPGCYVVIRVKDEGVGIPKEYLPKVFDPFFTTKQSGSGLGLATSYSIIKKHEGKIIVESQAGKGTSFTIFLPASDSATGKPVRPENEAHDEIIVYNGRVLLMDDEPFVRETASEMLNQLGLQVDFALDGVQAIEMTKRKLAEQQPYDLIIMDLTIPGGMGGVEAAAKILQMEPQTRIVVSSGYSSDPVMSNYRDYGFCGRLKKPFKIQEMQILLNEIFDSKASLA